MQELQSMSGNVPPRDQSTINSFDSKPIDRRRHPLRWLIFSGVILIVMLGMGTALMVETFRERALENSKRELENTVLLLTRHFDQQLEEAEVVQKDILEYLRIAGITTAVDYRRRMSSEAIHQLLKSKISAMSYLGALSLVDSEGVLIATSRAWPTPDVNLANREYFKILKADPKATGVLSEPLLSRVTGAWTITLSRRLNGPTGEFLGVVSRGIEPRHFEPFFQALQLGDAAAITMFHLDGTVLARIPQQQELIGLNFSKSPLFTDILSRGDHGTTLTSSFIDRAERLASVRQLTRFPLAIVATRPVSDVLVDWRGQTRLLTGVAALCAIVIAGMLFLIVRQLSRHHRWNETQLALEKERLNTAIDNMTFGLLLFDRFGRVVVRNQRYIDMYGLSPDVVTPGRSFREVIIHRKATGSLKGDVEEYCDQVLRERGRECTTIVEAMDGRFIQVANKPLADGGWVVTHEDITERRYAEERIAHLAHYDSLTDLPNRVMFGEQLERELKRLRRGHQFAILYIDIDEFKSINDTLGHPVGDELLKMVAARLRECLRETDFVARLGGDEFAIVQTEIRSAEDATDLVARIYEAIRRPYHCMGHQISTDASIGIALAPTDGDNLEQLLKNADLAMYGAKADGRRTCRFFEPEMDAKVKMRHRLESDLRQVTSDGRYAEAGLEVYFQPIVSLQDGAVVGCEALLRWRHPERGMISPVEFIPVAEDTGLIGPLGEWVTATACAEATKWPDDIRIAVNVSPVQFKGETFALRIAALLATTGLAPGRLELEITEAVLIRDDEAALAILHELRGMGVRIALDDFGTGYSSLSYLQRFPFDKIKIDRCFVSDIEEAEGSSAIIRAVVTIAAARNMTTTAEGVETEQQRALLQQLGCTEMQGYLFSPAKPAADVRALLDIARGRARSGSVAA